MPKHNWKTDWEAGRSELVCHACATRFALDDAQSYREVIDTECHAQANGELALARAYEEVARLHRQQAHYCRGANLEAHHHHMAARAHGYAQDYRGEDERLIVAREAALA